MGKTPWRTTTKGKAEMKRFKDFMVLKEQAAEAGNKDWRKEHIQLEKGFIPPSKLRSVIEAFLKSGDVPLMKDTTKGEITMDKKSLFLVGGPVRDFLSGKSIKDYDLATPATPEQVAHILHNAGFSMSPERTGKEGEEVHLTFKPKPSRPGDKKIWYVKGRDTTGKPFVVGAVVDGEDFDIATFRKDAKVTDGAAKVDFVDNPHEDASRRDLTINAMYIELTKPDGENNKLYDPTGKGWHDAKHGIVRAVGKAEKRFEEDKLRVLRAVRMHCRFGKGSKMDPDIERSIPQFRTLRGVALERVRDEFLKGLLHPDVDTQCYLSIYKRTGLLEKVFPGVDINMDNVPKKFRDRRDKPLALAWILQNNPLEKVAEAMGRTRGIQGEDIPTGWANQERKAVLYLLMLKEFHPNDVDEFMKQRAGTGLSDDQIRDWADYFRFSDAQGRERDRRPAWAKMVRHFSEFKPDPREQITWQEKLPHPSGEGYAKGGIHPEIIAQGLHTVHPVERSGIVKALNKAKLSKMFQDMMPKNV